VLGQGAHAQLDAAQLLEMADERVGSDAHEARREAALRHECLPGAVGDAAHGPGHGHVLGEVEVVGADPARRLGDGDVAVIGQARDHRIHRVCREVGRERRVVPGVEPVRPQALEAVRLDDPAGDSRVHVGELDVVVPGLGEQTRDQ
jgi:hypothetical protein